MRFNFQTRRPGVSLLETLVAVTLLVSLIAIVATFFKAFSFTQSTKQKQLAFSLLEEQMEIWRSIPYADLVDQTSQPFQNVLYHKGMFIVTDQQAQGGLVSIAPRTHEGSSGVTSLITPPIGAFAEDGTFTFYFYVPSPQPTGWKLGAYIRARDEENGYMLELSNSGTAFNLLSSGLPTSLLNDATAHTLDAWHKVDVTMTGNQFSIAINNSELVGSPITDISYARGYLGLYQSDSLSAYFDTVSFTTATNTFSWDFEDVENLLDEPPLQWKRASIYELPEVVHEVTIATAISNDTSPLKQITATLSWSDKTQKSITFTTYVAETGIAK